MIREGRSFSGKERHCCYLNTGASRFANVSAATGLDLIDDGRAAGVVDMDQDGDLDIIAGNLGRNYKYKATESEPFEVYYYDFDEKKLEVIGRNNKNVIALGDRVVVKVIKTDIDRRTIDLLMLENS